MVKPDTRQVVAAFAVQPFPPEVVTTYDVTGEPFATAASHDTSALPLSAVALTFSGAEGAESGVALTTAGTDLPAAFEAVTVNVSTTPFARPVNRHVVTVDVKAAAGAIGTEAVIVCLNGNFGSAPESVW